jgi:hypothetical protein
VTVASSHQVLIKDSADYRAAAPRGGRIAVRHAGNSKPMAIGGRHAAVVERALDQVSVNQG